MCLTPKKKTVTGVGNLKKKIKPGGSHFPFVHASAKQQQIKHSETMRHKDIHDTGCLGLVQWDGMGREEGGGFRMGNTCIPMADSFQYMAKPIQYCKVKT